MSSTTGPAISARRIPVSTKSRMIASSRRWMNVFPDQVPSNARSWSSDSTRIGLSVTVGGFISTIGERSSSSSSATSQR